MEFVPLSDAKAQLSAFVDRTQAELAVFTITRHGKPAAVLLSHDQFESMSATITWLSDAHHTGELAVAEAEIAEAVPAVVVDRGALR